VKFDIKQLLLPICLLIVIFILPGMLNIDWLAAEQVVFKTAQLNIKGRVYHLEIAQTAQQRQQGLMHRDHLSRESAMLFVYPTPGDHRIWMKNTLIPLMVVWLDDDQTVIHIQQLQPCESNPCPVFRTDKPSRYIIEFEAGFRGLAIGERLSGIREITNH